MTRRLALGLGGGAVGWVAFLLAILLATAAGAPPTAAAVLGGAVPATYKGLIERSAQQCPQIPVATFAAQLQAESDFNPDAVSHVGAMGIAQFMPGTWVGWGRDVDGNGRASPFDPADAIDAQVRFLCDLHRTALRSGIPGDPILLALAGYNAGWGAVRKYRGIPPYRETRGYVRKIAALAPQFQDALALPLPVGRADLLPSGAALPRANPRTVAQAIEWARKQAVDGPAAWYNRCLNFTAQAYGWHHSGTHYAIDHFTVVTPPSMRHVDRNPPPGALLYWETGRRPGHVALYLGNGLLASNDIESRGRISVVPMSAPERKWGARYVGWAPPYFPNAG